MKIHPLGVEMFHADGQTDMMKLIIASRNSLDAVLTLDAGLLARSQYPKVLRPATATQVFLGFPVSISECSDGSQVSKLLLHAPHVALQT